MLRELYDDLKRRRRDNEVNAQRYYKLTSEGAKLCNFLIGKLYRDKPYPPPPPPITGRRAVKSSDIKVSDVILIDKVSTLSLLRTYVAFLKRMPAIGCCVLESFDGVSP